MLCSQVMPIFTFKIGTVIYNVLPVSYSCPQHKDGDLCTDGYVDDGGQIQTLKKNLHTFNTNARDSVPSMPMSRTFIQDSGSIYDGHYLATIFVLAASFV